jgi:hypothetical protein
MCVRESRYPVERRIIIAPMNLLVLVFPLVDFPAPDLGVHIVWLDERRYCTDMYLIYTTFFA